jgi:cellulose synthase (UDP-forming)
MTERGHPSSKLTPNAAGDIRLSSTQVFGAADWVVWAFLTALNASALVALLAFSTGATGMFSNPVSIAIMALLLVGLALWWIRWLGLPLMRKPTVVSSATDLRVGVATTFVPGAESLEMLEETVQALVAMSYPHETWVLDEGDDPTVRAICDLYDARHFTRRYTPAYNTDSGRFARATKYGNYNAWLAEIGFDLYDVIVSFDPDHAPVRAFLERVLGFFCDSDVGYVQAAQVYYNQSASFIARGAAEETYTYYSSLQMTSFALSYPIVTGCHNAHRTSALREIGGFPAHEADDLLMTIGYGAAGYRGVYVPEVLARGITPVDWGGYLGQQRRWARSVMDVKLWQLPRYWRRLSLRARLAGMVHGLHYLYPLTTVLGIALLVYLLVSGAMIPLLGLGGAARIAGVALALLLGDAYRQRFFIDRRRELGVHWRSSVLRFAKWPALLLGLADALRRKKPHYLLTPKAQTKSRRSPYLWPHAVVAGILAACWAVGFVRGADPQLGSQLIAGVTAAISLLVFMSGRSRFPAPYDRVLQRAAIGHSGLEYLPASPGT